MINCICEEKIGFSGFRDLVTKLIGQGKSVVVMVPPHGEERIKLHHHWEEVPS